MTHKHHTCTQLDAWPAERWDEEAVCSWRETVAHHRHEREKSKEKDDKLNCNITKMVSIHKI